MKKIAVLCFCVGFMAAISTSRAIDLKESKVTQVINDVQIISAANQAPKPAVVDDLFSMPDILRTGASSRAELIAKDETVTRVGANTIFSFDPASRTIDLKQGSLLFHSPHGKGGGTIRTGSATASVLGTTLIVTTTPNGGMKVLNLEGKVEVKMSDDLKQKLTAGQMTFILPGGKQLAPIIVFRLDELVKNSQLVKGFAKPLTSIPLIQDQIDRQRKLIKQGKASDTGLLVGDSATPNQVEVLDPNTIQNSTQLSSGAKKALSVDATLTGSSLKDPLIPTPPARIFLNTPFALAGNSYFAGQKFRGFAGQNITFNSAGPLTIDMSPYAGRPVFDFVAARNINLSGSVTFDGLSVLNQLFLIGGEQVTFAPNTVVQADAGNFQISTPGDLSLASVRLVNGIGNIGLNSGSTISLNNSAVLPAGEMILTAPVAINLFWSQDAFLGQQGFSGGNALITDPNTGAVNIIAQSGSLTVSATSIQAHYLTLNSGDSILLDAAGHTLTATGPGATANFTAPNLITVNNADLTHFGVVNMAANTLNLSDVSFAAGSTITLKSLLGLLNVGSSVPGHVNFIQNVTYGGNPAQNYVNNGGGITVTTLH